MIGFTLAIGDFMAMLVTSALWAAAGIVAQALLAAGALAGIVAIARRRRG